MKEINYSAKYYTKIFPPINNAGRGTIQLKCNCGTFYIVRTNITILQLGIKSLSLKK